MTCVLSNQIKKLLFNLIIFRRIEAEHLADLKQEKYYLETQVGNLECELQEANMMKENMQTHMDKLQQTMAEVSRESFSTSLIGLSFLYTGCFVRPPW